MSWDRSNHFVAHCITKYFLYHKDKSVFLHICHNIFKFNHSSAYASKMKDGFWDDWRPFIMFHFCDSMWKMTASHSVCRKEQQLAVIYFQRSQVWSHVWVENPSSTFRVNFRKYFSTMKYEKAFQRQNFWKTDLHDFWNR